MAARHQALLLLGTASWLARAHADTPPIALPPVTVSDEAPQDDPKSYVRTHAATATKTDTPILEIPASIQVVTRQVLQDQQVISLDQALQNVSGVTEGGGGANDNGQPWAVVRIRGFGSDAFLLDGTRLYSFGSDSSLFSEQFAGIDSIEVLKGPAAILYGALEPGGIVNIVSRQPQAIPDYALQQQIGSWGLYRTSIDATGPLNESGTVLYRLDASFQDDGSPIEYVYDDTRFVAPTLRWTIDSATALTVEFKYRALDLGQNYGTVPLFNGVPVSGPDVNYGARSPLHETTYYGTISWSHQFDDDLQLRQRIVFNEIRSNGAGILPLYVSTGVATPSGVGVGRVINNVVNDDQNFNFTTDLVDKLSLFGIDQTLLAGFDAARYRQDGHINQSGQTDNNISYVDFFDPGFVLNGFTCCTTVEGIDSGRTDTAGLYLQDQAALPGHLYLLAGMRWQYLRQSGDFDFPAYGFFGTSPILTADVVSPRAGVLWRATDWFSPYASYVESFGPSSSGSTLPNGQQVPPSSGRQVEFGVKASLLDDRLLATVAFYNLVKTNIPSTDIANPNFVVVTGEARSVGEELDVKGEVAPGWDIILNYAHTRTRTIRSSPLDVNPVGARFGGVPSDQAHLWTTYAFQTTALEGWRIGGGVTYAGSAPYTLISAGPGQTLPSYVTADAMVSYGFQAFGHDWSAQLNATNLLDREYVTDAQAYAFTPVPPYSTITYLYGPRRTLVGALKVTF